VGPALSGASVKLNFKTKRLRYLLDYGSTVASNYTSPAILITSVSQHYARLNRSDKVDSKFVKVGTSLLESYPIGYKHE
jgi:hypothetical protein